MIPSRKNSTRWCLTAVLERLYRVALRVYPAKFRRAFGREMIDAFRDSSLQVRQRGRVRLVAHGFHALCELVFQGVLERALVRRRATRVRRSGRAESLGGRKVVHGGLRWILESLTGDFRHAVRGFQKSPGFAVTVVAVLALGIGANTAIFSVVNGVLLRPLPYPDPDELVNVWQVVDSWLESPDPRVRAFGNQAPASYPVLKDWVEHATALRHVGGYSRMPEVRTIDFGDRLERISMTHATSGVFSALAVPSSMGRVLVEADDSVGAGKVAVLSHGFWQSRFGSDSTVIGRTISLDNERYHVVGVMPPVFYFPDPDCVLWANFGDERKQSGRQSLGLLAVGRLRSGLSLDAAQQEMQAMNERIVEATLGEHGLGVRLNSRANQVVGGARPVLLVLLGVVTLVLVIACANIAGLLLMRATANRREVALRSALGAGRGRLVRQLLVECLTIAVLGGLLGLAIAFAAFEPMLAWLPRDLPRLDEVALDYRVMLFTFGVSMFAGLLVSVLPAFRTSHVSFTEILSEGGRPLTGSRRHRRLQSALVTVEIALALVMIVGSGLLVMSLIRLTTVDRGFEPSNVLTMAVALPEDMHADAGRREMLFRSLKERLLSLPGVQHAAFSGSLPFVSGISSEGMTIEGSSGLAQGTLEVNDADPDFFHTLAIPVLAGRVFEAADLHDAEPVAVVNATAAAEYWPGENPVGRRIRITELFHAEGQPPGPWTTIVGVVGDVRVQLDREPRPKCYFPVAQSERSTYMLAVKTDVGAEALAAAARGTFLDLAPAVPIPGVHTLDGYVARSAATARLQATLVSGLAVLAGLLAVLGVYGLISNATAQRTAEFGVRIALGARTSDVRRDVLVRGATQAGFGLLLGLAVSLGAVRVLQGLLYQTDIYDPFMFLGSAALLGVAALAASYMPARRATNVNPVEALRRE